MAKKILIIEDEKILREMYHDKFVQAGFDITTANSQKRGLRLFQR